MKTTKTKIIELGILTIGILIITLSLVSSLGVSSPYTVGSPLGLYPGETRDVQIMVSASPSEGNSSIKVDLTDSEGIAIMTDSSNTYSLSGGSEKPVNIRIKIPENAVIGQKYPISLTASKIGTGGTGMVGVSLSSSFSLPVVVVEKPVAPVTTAEPAPEEPVTEGINPIWWILGIIVIIAIIAIIWFVVKSRKE